MRQLLFIFAFLALNTACEKQVRPPAEQLEMRLLYSMHNPGFPNQREELVDILSRAGRVGYNGVVLNDFRVSILDPSDPAYLEGLSDFGERAAKLGIEVIPSAGSFGWSESLLYSDPNLVEAMPVRDQRLQVENGVARPAAGDLVKNGGFEDASGDDLASWTPMDRGAVRISRTEHLVGRHAVLLQDIPRNWLGHRNGRLLQQIEVKPWTQYRASMWVKTQGATGSAGIRLFAMADDAVLTASDLNARPTQPWTNYNVIINPREHERIDLYVGIWGGGDGAVWIDDIRLEETAFVNLVRREGAELVVRGDNGVVYQEERDYVRLADPRMGRHTAPGRFDRYHPPPLLRLTADSAIQEGETLVVSYYHAVTAKRRQATVCLNHPAVYDLFEKEVRALKEALQPRSLLLGHDEILAANWCGSCRRQGRTAGELLAENLRTCTKIARAILPDAKFFVWNDMFDPHHNARTGFALVNGDLTGSWEGLPEGATVLNWNRMPSRSRSIDFFGSRGYPQVIVGFYDGRPPAISQQLAAGHGRETIVGAMYATFRRDFSQIERFASDAWGGAAAAGPHNGTAAPSPR